MISSSQIKAARVMLGWSAAELAKASKVGAATIRRYEMQKGVPSANLSTIAAIKQRLEKEGIEFTGDPLVNPGVTLNLKKG